MRRGCASEAPAPLVAPVARLISLREPESLTEFTSVDFGSRLVRRLEWLFWIVALDRPELVA
jgi:hypothetical protein